jgi:hypothetical protein
MMVPWPRRATRENDPLYPVKSERNFGRARLPNGGMAFAELSATIARLILEA